MPLYSLSVSLAKSLKTVLDLSEVQICSLLKPAGTVPLTITTIPCHKHFKSHDVGATTDPELYLSLQLEEH